MVRSRKAPVEPNVKVFGDYLALDPDQQAAFCRRLLNAELDDGPLVLRQIVEDAARAYALSAADKAQTLQAIVDERMGTVESPGTWQPKKTGSEDNLMIGQEVDCLLRSGKKMAWVVSWALKNRPTWCGNDKRDPNPTPAEVKRVTNLLYAKRRRYRHRRRL
jgi:hypothetical protein